MIVAHISRSAVYCWVLRKICRRWIEEMATIEEATLIFRLPASSLPRKETSPLLLALVEAADEVLVAGDHHHDDEARDQRGIDQPSMARIMSASS